MNPELIVFIILKLTAILLEKAPEIAEIISKDPNIDVESLKPTAKADLQAALDKLLENV